MAQFIDKYLLEYLSFSRDRFSWNSSTSLIVVGHVINFLPGLDEHDTLLRTIRRLNRLAEEWSDIKFECSRWRYEREKMEAKRVYKEQEMERVFINSFMPEVRRFFNIPKLQQLSETDKSLKQNEVLAGFIIFLLHILDSERMFLFGYQKHLYATLQKYLTILFTILGDTPFWCTEHKDVKNLFMELKSLAKKAGNFIYSFVFAHRGMRYNIFGVGIPVLLKRIHIFLNVKLNKHNFKVLELPKTTRIGPLHSPFIVDSLLEDLEGFMNGRYSITITDIEDHIKMLIDGLVFTQTVLKVVQPLQVMHTHEVKESLIEIREVAYEAEFLINTYVMGRLPTSYLNFRLPSIVQKVKLSGRGLQEQIQKSSEIKETKITDGYDRVISSQVVRNPGDVIENFVMGFEDNRNKILADLAVKSGKLKIISIFGMPGIGKSTIARKLYNDRAVYNHFDVRVWCVVSQTYNKTKVLDDILTCLGSKSDKDNDLQMGDESMGLKIYQTLYGSRYLIIMDDIWCSGVWDDLRRYFPDVENGSRILLTSRIKDIAPTDSIFYAPPLLSESQCNDLLLRTVFKSEPCPLELFSIAKRIASKCHGLPLAIVVVAGIVANLGKDESLWKNVENNLDSFMSDNQSNYMKILELSYEHLPDHLKPCFLYMAVFPEDKEVSMRKLMKLWIAEGFVQEKEEKSPEHIAEGYLFELVNRSLLMIAKRRSDGGIKACNIHDLLRDMCQRKATEEQFLKLVTKSSIYEQHSHLVSDSTPEASFAALHCRSIMGYLSSLEYHVSQMPLLRVINAVKVRFSSYEMARLCALVHLKYLCLSFNTTEFPSGLCELVNLEYLNFDASHTIQVPPIILKMGKLSHVCINYQAVFDIRWNNSKMTNNLKALSHVLIRNEEESGILKCSPHLRELKCISDGSLFPDLNFLTELESLSMKFSSPSKGVKLTEGYFPSSIKKLSLYRTRLPWDQMAILGSLPNLHVLKLICCAFVGEKWEMGDYEFVKLRFLKLSDFSLKQWDASSEHFPELECLVLEFIRGPVQIPLEFYDILTLERIEVHHCRYEMETSAVLIEEERRRNGNDDLKVTITRRPKDELDQEKCDDEDEDDVSETGVAPEDIELVMSHVRVSRGRAVKTLKAADGDIVTAIMDLSS